ncbi:DUF4006 family protein [Helicobacter trogontum]|uniref:DUF4006 family protein n=1 Tax=Helicobacter trogontum TaxID=50960 RepID=A0A4U8TI33_9HELI|nr:DUF4006 family protein [Helicobacter trogontum]MCI5787450.1 DUF4006 family protein [Helicobacter trogontum]MDY5186311.1 DUF4006 family protein [Helicobacter trogontum]TLD99675.1 DUF4006 family protein [Helicobacter trogontum]
MQAIINVLNSLVGFFLAVLLVVIVAAIGGYNAMKIQQSSATTFYSVDSHNLKKNDTANQDAFKIIENKE